MYKFVKTVRGDDLKRTNADGSVTSIPFDPANTDFQEYQRWLAEGNEPLPADEQPTE
jgi:hypothetical protein